ncbi:unnamed protein product, partial [Allacma fusca]
MRIPHPTSTNTPVATAASVTAEGGDDLIPSAYPLPSDILATPPQLNVHIDPEHMPITSASRKIIQALRTPLRSTPLRARLRSRGQAPKDYKQFFVTRKRTNTVPVSKANQHANKQFKLTTTVEPKVLPSSAVTQSQHKEVKSSKNKVTYTLPKNGKSPEVKKPTTKFPSPIKGKTQVIKLKPQSKTTGYQYNVYPSLDGSLVGEVIPATSAVEWTFSAINKSSGAALPLQTKISRQSTKVDKEIYIFLLLILVFRLQLLSHGSQPYQWTKALSLLIYIWHVIRLLLLPVSPVNNSLLWIVMSRLSLHHHQITSFLLLDVGQHSSNPLNSDAAAEHSVLPSLKYESVHLPLPQVKI